MNYTKLSIWGLGFRPFFLFGSLISALLMFIWVGFQAGWIKALPYYTSVIWHAHEMLYGFVVAIVTGFLLTATQNWSGIRGVHAGRLVLLWTLWLLGRLLPFITVVPPLLVALVDLSFLPALAIALIPYIGNRRQRQNQIIFLILGLLFTGNLLVHLDVLGFLPGMARRGVFLGLNTLLVLIALIGGRVIPAFTRNGIQGAQVRAWQWLEIASMASVLLFIVADFFWPASVYTAGFALLVAAIHGLRFAGWGFWQVRRVPILWILFCGYAWLVLGFFLKGISMFVGLHPGISTHAFTTGAIGVLIYAMIGRVSIGHTGRPMHAPPWLIVGYVLINLAALVRVVFPIFSLQAYSLFILISGTFWFGAYLIFFIYFWPILTRARPDGRPG